jgi:hypothetical protein
MEKQITAVEWQQEHGQKVGHNVQVETMEKEQKYTEQQMIEYGRFCVQCHEQGFIIPKNK